ncbi:hypothetical protein BH23BAC4_BH23BAC4_10460 [soil metagenome]
MRYLIFSTALIFGASLLAPQATAQTTPAPDTVRVDSSENQARGMFNQGNELLRAQDFQGALAQFERGIRLHDENARNHFGRAVALAQLNRREDAVESFIRARELAVEQGDTEMAQTASRQVSTLALVQAQELMGAQPLPEENAQRVVDMLAPAQDMMSGNSTYYYFLARSYNALGQHDDGARFAQLALDNATAQNGDHSPLNYELGYAEMHRGNEDAARTAFQEAMSGSYAGWAEYQIGVLDAGGEAGASAETAIDPDEGE